MVSDRLVGQLCEEQKIEDFVFHDLRHCAVTNMADAGVAPEVIMKAVGHLDPEMFLRYRSVQPSKLNEAMERFNSYLATRQTLSLTPQTAKQG